MPPTDFWDFTLPSYNAAMRGALKARRERYQADRDLALMTAYFSAQLAPVFEYAPKQAPSWEDWHLRMTQPPQPISSADRVQAFAALAAQGFDITITKH